MCRLKQPGIKSPTLWLVDELNYIHPWCYAGMLVRLCLGISLIAATNLQTVFSQVGSSKKNSIWRTELPAKAWIWCSGCKADSFTYKGYNFLYTFYLNMWKLQQFLFSLKNHWAVNPMRESCLFFIGEYSVFVSSFVSYIQRFLWTVCVSKTLTSSNVIFKNVISSFLNGWSMQSFTTVMSPSPFLSQVSLSVVHFLHPVMY